jgi:HAMP domain-containing protein/predicted Ser/Thr protein kinase
VKPKGLSLTVKIFLSTALVVVVIIATTLAIAARQASEAADVSVNRVLGSAREAVNAQLAGSANGLRAAAEAFAENANFGALVEAAEPGDALDQAQEAGATLGAKWVQITNASGFRLAKSDEPGADTLTLGERSLEVASALGGQSTGGFGVTARNELLILEAVPIYRGTDRIVGALFAARDVDSTFAAKVKSSAASELDVVFFTSDTAGATVIAASTLGRDAEVVRAISTLPMGSADSSEARVETDLRGRHYIGLAEVLRGADGGVVGRYLMLRDRDAEFASFQRLQRSLLLTGGVGILVAALLSLLIANQITRPVGKLVEATRRAADGDYKAVIPSTSKDEIGVLAGAFRGLLADLREKQELVEFLSSADAAKTVQMRAMSATTEQRVAGVGLTPGSRFAVRYEVKEVLGEGGMGTVFKAIDTELGEVIAIKTLKQDFLSQDPTALERFKSEIRLARKISHRNVVRTHDLGENSGVYFITMEYVDGKSLKDLIRAKGKLPLPITLSVGKQLARALEVAHEQGVIHRDIKPQNMVVEPDGVLKVMDFGIARLATRKPESGVTQAGMIIGTPEYMAPEQFAGDEIDARADIYAAGCVLYECLTGRTPFQAETPYQLVAKVLEETAPSPRRLNPEVPPALEALVMAALSKDPAGRPQTALALHDRLAQIG